MRIVHPGNFQCFVDEYEKQLKTSYMENPSNYSWSICDFYSVFERMKRAIERGSFNKDSKAFKRTCKALGLKHTYKAIDQFILTYQKGEN